MSTNNLLSKYRPDIDGLRAVAVLLVLGYHAFPRFVPGGFIGVDVFFVISGYLISSIILAGLSQETFRFRDFYARRIKRIFPALLLVLAGCFAIGWFTLLPQEFEQLGKHTAGGAAFSSNFVLWNESGYFDSSAELKPLLHLWSLGIEEQFYIVWPLFLYIAWKLHLRLPALIVSIVFVSFALNAYQVRTNPVAAFYSPATRFWEITIGSALAYFALFKKHPIDAPLNNAGLVLSPFKNPVTLRNVSAGTGFLLIVISAFVLNSTRAFPGWWALLPTIGACLLIWAGPDAWPNEKVLANPAMVFIGLISYPLYLWHWPLLSYVHILGLSVAHVRLGALLVSFALAALTYQMVEKPIRFANVPLKVAGLAFLMAIACGTGLFTFKLHGLASRMRGRAPQLILDYATLNYDFTSDARYGVCWLTRSAGADAYPDTCLDGGDTKPVMFLWGDSHAGRLFPGLRLAASDRFRLGEYTRDSCAPILGYGYDNCQSGNAFVLKTIRRIKPEVVILFAVWSGTADALGQETMFAKLDQTVAEIAKAGTSQIIVIGPTPKWTGNLPRLLLNKSRQIGFQRVPERTYFGAIMEVRELDESMEKFWGMRRGVLYFSAWKSFCNQEGCLTRVSEDPDGLTTWDYGHLTTRGAEYLARKLLVALVRADP